MKDFITHLIFVSIIVAFSMIGLIGIKWGLPAKNQIQQSFHPDETPNIDASLSIIKSGKFLYPGEWAFMPGTMQHYIIACFYIIFSKIKPLRLYTVQEHLDLFKDGKLTFNASMNIRWLTLIPRYVTFFMFLLSVIVIYLIGIFLTKSRFRSFIYSMFLTSLPTIVINAQYFKKDIPALFWILLSFLFLILWDKKNSYLFLALSGIFAGFATATKYYSAFVIIIFFALIFFNKRINYKDFLFFFIPFIIGFLIGCPGSILYTKSFLTGIKNQFLTKESRTIYNRIGVGHWSINYLTWVGRYAFGLPFVVMIPLGIIFGFKTKIKYHKLLIIVILTYYFIITLSSGRFIRYLVPISPFFVILIVDFIFYLYDLSKKKKYRFLKYTVPIVSLFVFFYSTILTLSYCNLKLKDKIPNDFTEFLCTKIPPGSKIGVYHHPAFFLQPCANFHIYSNLVKKSQDLLQVQYVVVSDIFSWKYYLYPETFKRWYRELKFLENKFILIKTLETERRFLFFKFKKGIPPEDILYFYQTVKIYMRK